MPFTTADAAAERITDIKTGLALGPSNEPTAKSFPKNKWLDTECKLQKRRVNDAKKNSFLSLTTLLSDRVTIRKRRSIRPC